MWTLETIKASVHENLKWKEKEKKEFEDLSLLIIQEDQSDPMISSIL